MRFRDRRDAGRRLANELTVIRHEHPVVLALPRGGVPVAAEVAEALEAPLDVLVVRKIGYPLQPELGVGAVGESGPPVFNLRLLRDLDLVPEDLERVVIDETREVHRRVAVYRGSRPGVPVTGRTVVLVDDGVATGFTLRAGVQVLREQGAGRIVIAVPVGARAAVSELRRLADEVVCLSTPEHFAAIGEFYADFGQVPDEDVVALLERARTRPTPGRHDAPQLDVTIPVDGVTLHGTIALPRDAAGVIVFAHGSGSSRLSPRNQAVATELNQAGWATLLFDLLTPDEARDRALVFDLPLLTRRLIGVTRWLRDRSALAGLPLAYFGASTGAAAALSAAATLPDEVAAVVSRGGRPDLASKDLPRVVAPTLLVVGGEDEVVLDLNRRAQAMLTCPSRLDVVPGATHLFEEPGALEAVTAATNAWLHEHLRATAPRR